MCVGFSCGENLPKNPKCLFSGVLIFLMVKVSSVYSWNITFLYLPPMCPSFLLKNTSEALRGGGRVCVRETRENKMIYAAVKRQKWWVVFK